MQFVAFHTSASQRRRRRDDTPKRKVLIVPAWRQMVLALAILVYSSAAFAGGPVMLAGHDADDHGFAAIYADLLDAVRSQVANGGDGILAIGANVGSNAGNWIASVASQMTPPQTVTFVNGSAISSVSFAGYAMLYVPSTDRDTAGGISLSSEQSLLVGRAVDVATFISNGGGLFGLTQAGAVVPYGYLGLFMSVAQTSVPATGDCDGSAGSQRYDNITPTPLGTTLGITDTNVDGCCWHNVFTAFPDFLDVLAVANEPRCSVPQVINGLPSVIGCTDCGIPGQLALAPARALNPPSSVHEVTATLLQATSPNAPIANHLISFAVTSGPNAGSTGSDRTDTSGEATFAYPSNGVIGVDRIQATCPNPAGSGTLTANEALKFWDVDCNENGIPDTCDVDCDGFGGDCMVFAECGVSTDGDADGFPDECQECVSGTACDDGSPCTENDTCTLRRCAGTPVDCSSLDAVCAVGVCNGDTGICEARPSNDGGTCDDGEFCNGADSCGEGSCSQHAGNPCAGGADCADTCDEATESCLDSLGAPCDDDGNVCTNDECDGLGVCTHPNNTASCDDEVFCNGFDTCGEGTCSIHSGDPCAGAPECADACNEAAGSCLSPAGTTCTDDGNICTDDRCSETGTCEHPNNTAPCSDSNVCTQDDVCIDGSCVGEPVSCGNGVLDGDCGEQCDPPDGTTCDDDCILIECGNGVVQPGEDCDVGVDVPGDCCDAECNFATGACDDLSGCTTDDSCTDGVCSGSPVDCSHLDGPCVLGRCEDENDTSGCVIVYANEGEECSVEDQCTDVYACRAGICSACGNGSVDPTCGESCDPPTSGSCDGSCQISICGNGVPQAGEECDDGNLTAGDGCSAGCLFEEKFCFVGRQPGVAVSANRIVFASRYDYVGKNADGSQEIFLFERRRFDKEILKLRKQGMTWLEAKNTLIPARTNQFFFQITESDSSVVNENPTVTKSGKIAAFLSDADLTGNNPDRNPEIFRVRYKLTRAGSPGANLALRLPILQVTDTTLPVVNRNPNLRAFGNLLSFDSNGDLNPGKCVGGKKDLDVCTSDAQCAGATCGNPDENREVFVHIYRAVKFGHDPLRQLTATTFPHASSIGQTSNFNSRKAAFTSTANFKGTNPNNMSQILRIARAPESLTVVTKDQDSDQAEPGQSRRGIMAFSSDGDLEPGSNPDRNREIFISDPRSVPLINQIKDDRGVSPAGCSNSSPSFDGFGRFVAFDSTCNRLVSVGNPNRARSIFIWDQYRKELLSMVVRGQNDGKSSDPQMSSRARVLTYVSNEDGPDAEVCTLNFGAFLSILD